ncbi:GntR family transcriptional regulator [uncultured Aquitalea sp.]|uniref:GntR family transcriptional regulator n=1 Tax=uncultured Aquitalea sp. TaxID=540272 RepID=UPI0025EA93E9|nr:GntR family transcriptional regulator [uncultured Aquitalea sp.]
MITTSPRRLPLYAQIRQLVANRIAEGEWQEHDALPSEWDLAAELSVSQGTVRKALTELVAEGLLYRQQGRGTFVSAIVSDWGFGQLRTPGLFDESPDRLACEFLGVSRVNASDDMSSALRLRRLAPMFRIRQLWRRQGRAVALDEAFLCAERFEGLEARWFRGASGVYAVLQQRFGVRVVRSQDQFRGVLLPREDATLLGLTGAAVEEPVLSLLRLSFSAADERVEWRQRYCLSSEAAVMVDRP